MLSREKVRKKKFCVPLEDCGLRFCEVFAQQRKEENIISEEELLLVVVFKEVIMQIEPDEGDDGSLFNFISFAVVDKEVAEYGD